MCSLTLTPGSTPPSAFPDSSTAHHAFCLTLGHTPALVVVRLLASGLPFLTLFHLPGAGVIFLKGPPPFLLSVLALLSVHRGYGLSLGLTPAAWQKVPW